MSDPLDSFSGRDPHTLSPETIKKKKMWRNLFIFNLCVSILLIGIFWVPLKFQQVNSFLAASSVNIPDKGEITQNEKNLRTAPQTSNLLATRSLVIDATSDEDWAYFDFSRGKQVKIMDASSLEWDLAFRRGRIISNGGASNKFGQAGLIDLGEVDFDAVESVPDRKFILDKSTRTDTVNPILENWYKYNYLTHKLTARRNIYVIRTADGKFSKTQFLSFYCADKNSGCIQMRYVYQHSGSKSFLKDDAGTVSLISTEASP